MNPSSTAIAAAPAVPAGRRFPWLRLALGVVALLVLATLLALAGALHAPPVTLTIDGEELWRGRAGIVDGAASLPGLTAAAAAILVVLVLLIVLPLVLFWVLVLVAAVVGVVLVAALGLPLLAVALVLALLASPLLLLGWLVWRLAS